MQWQQSMTLNQRTLAKNNCHATSGVQQGLTKKYGAEPNVRPPSAVSPMGGVNSGDKIYLVAKSRGPNSNAVAYAERALST